MLRGADSPPRTGYRYRFSAHELAAIRRCHDEHGFCVVSNVLNSAQVASLRADIEHEIPAAQLSDGSSEVRHAFVDFSPAARQLLAHPEFMTLQRTLLGVEAGVDDGELTVHRSAAIVRKPGAGGGKASSTWHTDWTGGIPCPLKDASSYLNRSEAPNGKWFCT